MGREKVLGDDTEYYITTCGYNVSIAAVHQLVHILHTNLQGFMEC